MWWHDAKRLNENQEIRWNGAFVLLTVLGVALFIASIVGIIVDGFYLESFSTSLVAISVGLLGIKRVVKVRDTEDTI